MNVARAAWQMQNTYLNNSHSIEVAMKDITVLISNDADSVLLTGIFHLLQELSSLFVEEDEIESKPYSGSGTTSS